MTLAQGMVDLIDERVLAQLTRNTSAATVVERTGATTAMVTLDGSALPVPVKCFGDVNVAEGDRVGLVRLGVDWTIVGTFTRRRSLTIPDGAPPSAPRIVMGSDIPPELVAWATPLAVTFLALEIYYYDATHYRFNGVGTFDALIRYFEGTYDPVNGVYITSRTSLFGGAGTPSLGVSVGTSLATFQLDYYFIKTNVSITDTSLLDLAFGSQFRIDGTSQPRGLIGYVDSAANTPAITTEAVTLTMPSNLLRAGRAFEARVWGHYQTTAAGTETAVVRVRLGVGITGATVMGMHTPILPQPPKFVSHLAASKFRVTTVGGVSTQMVATLEANTVNVTGGASAQTLRSFEIWDIGAASDFPTVPAI